jgi:hypothetical protein
MVKLPPPYFCSVTVREAGSRDLLSSATVRYEGQYGENWIRLEKPLNASLASGPDNPTPRVLLVAASRGGGHFVFAPVHRAEWSHVLFPIGLPLGGILHHYYLSSVVVTAPRHLAVRVSGRFSAQIHSPFAEYTDGLTVLLPRTTKN